MHPQIWRPKRPRSVVVATVLLLIVVMNIPSMLRYTQLRNEIDQRYFATNWAKVVVFEHAAAGDLAGLARLNGAADETISFSPTSGIITLAFSGFPDAPEETVRLVPLVGLRDATQPLAMFMERKLPLVPKMVRWICLPAVSSTRDQYLQQNRGTLRMELAPAECR